MATSVDRVTDLGADQNGVDGSLGISDGNNVIKCGDFVILITLLGKKPVSRLARVDHSGDVYLKKERVSTRSLIGSRFNSIHSLDRSTRELRDANLTLEQLKEILSFSSAFPDLNLDVDKKDNRNFLDDGLAQKLERDDIEALKHKGTSGDEIIRTLVSNSNTFADRNAFSQEKYLKKKQAKYSNLIRVLKPTPALLTQMYYSQGPMKINNFRLDSLAQMLTACNVRSGGKYMIIDTNMGLLTAAVLDRLVGDESTLSAEACNNSQCVQIFLDDSPVSSWRQSVYALNLPDHVHRQCLSAINLRKLFKWESSSETQRQEMFPAPSETSDQLIHSSEDFLPSGNNQEDGGSEANNPAKRSKLDDKAKRKLIRQQEEANAINALKTKDMDGLLIITRAFDPTDLLDFLFQFLASSQPFAVFSNSIDPLISCYHCLKGRAVNSRITETWFRRYQVLESRTRPDMNMSGAGGYLLTGTKVE